MASSYSKTAAGALPWITSDERPAGLAILGRQIVVALPWGQFFYAQGDDTNVHAVWTTHELTVTGRGLRELLKAFAAQSISQMAESPRTDRFDGAHVIIALDVHQVEGH